MSSGPHDKLRRQSRMSAVQALYQMDVAGLTSKQVIMEFLNHRFGYDGEENMVAADETFFEDLVNGVVERQDEIDKMIAENLSKNWTMKRLDLTLRAILRSGTYEMASRIWYQRCIETDIALLWMSLILSAIVSRPLLGQKVCALKMMPHVLRRRVGMIWSSPKTLWSRVCISQTVNMAVMSRKSCCG